MDNVFELSNVHRSFLKLEMILTLMIIRVKGFETFFFYITNLNTFGSNMLLTLKIMGFKNVALKNVVDIYVIKGMNA